MTTIGHLSVRASVQRGGSHTLRGAAEKLLASTDLRPPHLPSGATLVVRRLDALPRVAEERGAAAGWQEAARQRIALLYRHAYRPVADTVPANAPCVLFADTAELLACFTHDLLHNNHWARWYWRYVRLGSEQRPLLGHQAQARGALLTQAWCAAPEALPATFALLPTAVQLEVMGALSPREISSVVEALHRAFVVPDTIRQVRLPESAKFATVPPQGDGEARQPDLPTPMPHGAELPAPWQDWFAVHSVAQLSPQAHYLVGLCAALYHAPAYARSDDFARRAVLWLEQALRDWHAGPVTSMTPPMPIPTSQPKTAGRPQAQATANRTLPQAQANSSPPAEGAPDAVPGALSAAPTDTATHPTDPFSTSTENEGGWEVTQKRLSLRVQGQWTALGGILYLIHTLPWLALPGKWSPYLSAWAMLELLARGLGVNTLGGDFIWVLLAALDKRDGETPVGMLLPDDAAYVLANEELEATPRWVKREYAAYIAQTNRDADASQLEFETGAVSHNAARWLAARIGFYRWLLQRVLGRDGLENMLVAHGQIDASHTHIDLYLPMHMVNMAVRQAGLDANPGWSPDFGYIVLFHFVDRTVWDAGEELR